MRIQGRRWGALLAALLLVTIGATAKVARADEGGWLGVYTQELSKDLQDALDFDGDAVLVTKVVPDSPADRAGIRKGDLIARVNSDNIGSPSDLAKVIQEQSPGDDVKIKIVRDGETQTMRVTLASRDDSGDKKHKNNDEDGDQDFEAPVPPTPPDAPEPPMMMRMPGMGRGRLGVRIETLNPDLAEYFDVRDGHGVLVLDVMKGTPAEHVGMRPGDVIVGLNDRDVTDSDDLIKAISESHGKVEVVVVRHGSRKTFEADIPAGDVPRIMRLQRGGGWNGNGWSFDGNQWQRGTPKAPDATDRAGTDKELKELRDELQELKQDLEQLRAR